MTTFECPKCQAPTGDDWTQCEGVCPLPESPHYALKEKCRVCRKPQDAQNEWCIAPHTDRDPRGRVHEKRYFKVDDGGVYWYVVARHATEAIFFAMLDGIDLGCTDECTDVSAIEIPAERAASIMVLDEVRGNERYPLTSYGFGPVSFSEAP